VLVVVVVFGKRLWAYLLQSVVVDSFSATAFFIATGVPSSLTHISQSHILIHIHTYTLTDGLLEAR
jgi:hypothetical protein